ncbi:MAG TPA: hypothetical protein VGV35_09660 [Bryobacteraceae bacterium]|nr:hypothetical protein [Bryobacteraceae bacterium]
MRRFGVSIGLLAAILLSGCARARITTAIKPDGSWTRTVVLTGQEKKEGQMTPTLDDTFVIPSGAGWKKEEGTKNADRVVTLERSMAAGSSLQADVSVKGGEPGKLNLVNEVTVTKAGPRRFEYRETLRWKGDPAKSMANIKPEDLARIKGDLPKALATDANARALAQKTAELIIPMLFGPGDPLLAIGLLHPDLAERRAGQRMGTVMVKVLEEQFGDKMSPAERREVARKMIQGAFSSNKVSPPDPSSPDQGSKGPALVPLTFIVKTPGRVVSSNGEVDELAGEVFWALFSEAASFKDVVLTAVVEVGEK